MRLLTQLLIHLYPPRWRQRYEREFEAFLDDMQPLGRHLPDLLWGAIKMQMTEWSFLKLSLAFAAGGLLAAAAAQFALPDSFVSRGVSHMRSVDDVARSQQRVLSRTSLSAIINQNNLYPSKRERKPLEEVIEDMRTKDIHINAVSPDSFSLAFAYPDPVVAQKTARELMARLSADGGFEIVDTASLPFEPVKPNRLLILATGLGGGLVLGLLTAGVLCLRARA
jgi:hypothetical protein